MKILILLLMTVLSCNQNNVSEVPGTDSIPDTNQSGVSLISQGQLQGKNDYNSAGTVSLFYNENSDEYTISLENFSSDNGPDLHVYISEDSTASSFFDLGELKSTSGSQTYTLPASQFNNGYDTVLIWCAQVDESFGEASLE